MHSLRLEVDNSVYSQFLSLLDQFKKNEITIVENTIKEDFIVSSLDEVSSRVARAEKNAIYISHDKFWSDIDKKMENI